MSKKLIEVALPLDDVNREAAREKSIRHGHPSTLHLWWARRPLATARAVIFAQLVDDPAEYTDELLSDHDKKQAARQALQERDHAPATEPDKALQAIAAEQERERLFQIIRQLVRWENTTNEQVLRPARDEIRKSWRRACKRNHQHPQAAALFNPEHPPAFHDPFAGGGALPLEAQRLGMQSYASDLNPVAVLINKAMIEIPPQFNSHHPVHPEAQQQVIKTPQGAQGLAQDVRMYGKWMRDQAQQRIGHLYPKIKITPQMTEGRPDLKQLQGSELTVIAWIWARTVPSPNPAFSNREVPLASTFILSSRKGREAYVHPIINKQDGTYSFQVKQGKPQDPEAAEAGTSAGKRKAFLCLLSDVPISHKHIHQEAQAGRMGARLMAIVAEGRKRRIYLPPTPEHEAAAQQAKPTWKPDMLMSDDLRYIGTSKYGMKTFGDLFTPRQLSALNTLSDLIQEAHEQVKRDALAAGPSPGQPINPSGNPGIHPPFTQAHNSGVFSAGSIGADPRTAQEDNVPGNPFPNGTGAHSHITRTYNKPSDPSIDSTGTYPHAMQAHHAPSESLSSAAGPHLHDERNESSADDPKATAYADAVAMYLAFAVDKYSDYSSSICSWHKSGEKIQHTFGRQAIPMMWDYTESHPFCNSTGNFMAMVDWVWKALQTIPAQGKGIARQADATKQVISKGKVISTDPPYYDNVPYADLSDFFYTWQRRSLQPLFPELFTTLVVPKDKELVAFAGRHGSKQQAEEFFLEGMTQAMRCLAEQAHPDFPVTIYYAFKQMERDAEQGITSTGWETFLDALIRTGFSITGTWPMRTELGNRMRGLKSNALASSIVLVCRPRPDNAPIATRPEFLAALKAELPPALAHLQRSNIAPVDLTQAAIGPGMAVYTHYARVLDVQEGKPLSVRQALALINATLDEILAEQEGDFDADSRWASAWFEQSGFEEGEYGKAETLSKAKNTSVNGLVQAGILTSKAGKVRLLRPDELPTDWEPGRDKRLTVWEMTHHLIRILETKGEIAAGELVAKLGSQAETARELAYRLYTLCERKQRPAQALSYNGLVQSWPEITRHSRHPKPPPAQQTDLLDSPGTTPTHDRNCPSP